MRAQWSYLSDTKIVSFNSLPQELTFRHRDTAICSGLPNWLSYSVTILNRKWPCYAELGSVFASNPVDLKFAPPQFKGSQESDCTVLYLIYFYRHRNRGAHSIKSEREKELIIKIILRSPEKAETESSSRNSDKRYGDREAPHQTSRQQDRQRHAQTYTHTHTHTRGGRERERESRFQYTALSWGHRPAAGDTASRHLAVATGWALYTREARRLPTLQQSDYITGFSH